MKIIFSDLDGTLLDHNSYSFEPALEALARVKEFGVPLVLCSSKTKAEMLLWQERLGICGTFIAENGGGIYIPKGDALDIGEAFEEDGFFVIQAEPGRVELRDAFLKVRNELSVEMKSFIDMSVGEVMELTSLSEADAMLAMERSFTEPFIICGNDASIREAVLSAFAGMGLTVVRGGRFYHLMGSCDKGVAVAKVIKLFSKTCGGSITSLGLGDSDNDLAMLLNVDRPVLVKRPDGSWFDAPERGTFFKTKGVGPVGWNEAVLDFLAN
ncbi:MAG: HAD-IIB family hydrolase [bacterium]|nr:HAD-IIB family hydrolase [bacterium]